MKKYKLLQDYPPYKKGDIINDNEGLPGYYDGKENHAMRFNIVEEYPKHFAPYIFTTEDNVDIYDGEQYWWVTETGKIDFTFTNSVGGTNKLRTYFSTKEAAKAYLTASKIPKWVICTETYDETPEYGVLNNIYKVLKLDSELKFYTLKTLKYAVRTDRFKEATNAEVEAHLLGFHIGDKSWYNKQHENSLGIGLYFGIITDFSFNDHEEVTAISDKITKDYSALALKNITKTEPTPKIITEEGTKLYSDDKCWYQI